MCSLRTRLTLLFGVLVLFTWFSTQPPTQGLRRIVLVQVQESATRAPGPIPEDISQQTPQEELSEHARRGFRTAGRHLTAVPNGPDAELYPIVAQRLVVRGGTWITDCLGPYRARPPFLCHRQILI